MKIKSLKYNFMMYSIRMVSGLLFTLIVFPYIARTLGPVNLGKVQFAQSITIYFILFVNLGVEKYGQREIAYCGEDIEKRSKVFFEMISILLITTLINIIVYLILINSINILKDDKHIYILFLFQIIFNLLNIEWFYLGIEDQGYITKRTLFFKILSIFMFLSIVNKETDYYKYVGIVVLTLVLSNVFNFINAFKYIKLDKEIISDIKVFKHLKGMLILFTSILAISIFTSLDSLMIRIIAGEATLGYYGVASRIGRIPLMLTFGISTVLFPRLCHYVKEEDYENYYLNLNNGLNYMLILSIPCMIGLIFLAPEIILLLAGEKFMKAIPVIRVYAFIIPIMSLAVFMGSMTLIANKKEKENTLSVVIAAIFNVIFNLFFIPKMGAIGAALGTVLSELLGVIIRIIFARKLIEKKQIIDKNKLKIMVGALILIIILIFIKKQIDSPLMRILMSLIIGGGAYLIALILLKEQSLTRIKKEKVILN